MSFGFGAAAPAAAGAAKTPFGFGATTAPAAPAAAPAAGAPAAGVGPFGGGFGAAAPAAGAAPTPSNAGANLSDVHLKGHTLRDILKEWDSKFTDDFHNFQSASNMVQGRDREMVEHGNTVLTLIRGVDAGLEEARNTERVLEDIRSHQKSVESEVQRLEDRVDQLYSSTQHSRGRVDEPREAMYRNALKLFDEVYQVDLATERLLAECNTLRAATGTAGASIAGSDPLETVIGTIDWHLATIESLQREADNVEGLLRSAGILHDMADRRTGLHL